MKDIERKVWSLYNILVSPASEDDFAENARRVEFRRFVLVWVYVNLLIPTLRRLDGVIAKLEPLSEQHAFLKFLQNTDNAKTLNGFIQELADAVTCYQV